MENEDEARIPPQQFRKLSPTKRRTAGTLGDGEMRQAAKDLNFEAAADLRDIMIMGLRVPINEAKAEVTSCC